ncbi:helix-turn-helix domain-containing protein [Haladaptatus sp. CMAA 1909]|uniref:helix-turn-helix domain-containing protein n=1 Tax=Haladaptatus sp. CMAA 1909 TaxID=3368986 RepID=UPI0037540CB3
MPFVVTRVSTIAEIALPTIEFALHETFSRVPEARFEVVGVVAHNVEHVMPQLRVMAGDISAVERAFMDDDTVTDATLLTRLKDRGLFSMGWDRSVHRILSLIAMDDTAVLTAQASNGEWTFRIQCTNREILSRLYESCHDADVPLEVQNVQERTTMVDDPHELTQQQHETLRSAMKRGYYEIPRKVTTTDLAEELGVSHQAVSERLRRGHRSLVETGLSLSRQ